MPAEMRDSYGNWHSVDEVVNTGGEQTIRLLGPFPIAHDTPGVSDDAAPLELVEIDAGVSVIRAWAETGQAWTANTVIEIVLKDIGEGDYAWIPLTSYGNGVDSGIDLSVTSWAASEAFPRAAGGGSGMGLAGRAVTDAAIAVYVSSSDLSTGEADIYALIAEPAS